MDTYFFTSFNIVILGSNSYEGILRCHHVYKDSIGLTFCQIVWQDGQQFFHFPENEERIN